MGDALRKQIGRANKRSENPRAHSSMKRFRPRFSSLSLLGALLTSSWSALAQETLSAETSSEPEPSLAAPAPSEPANPSLSSDAKPGQSAQATQGPIFVTVSLTGYAVSSSDVAAAIARELNVALSSVPEAARATFDVVATKDRDMSITFRDHSGHALKRVVKAPANDAQVSEVAALLAVNLSQDNSDELLNQLSPEPEPPASAPEPSPTPEPSLTPESAALPPAPALPFVAANGTVAYPLSIVRDIDQRSVGFELGLFYSRVGAVDGFAINPLVMHVRQTTSGLTIAGLGTIAGSNEYATPQEGARISGLFNYGKGRLEGFGLAGVLDYEHVDPATKQGLSGAQIAGVFSGVNADAEGAQIAGVASYAREFSGLQISGVTNIAQGMTTGGQFAGVVNYAEGTSGAQIGGAANVSTRDMEGAQIAGAVNIAGNVEGAQIGIVNIGKRVTGAQIGIVNVADEVDGASIGVVTYSKKGQTQLTTWFDSTRPVNIGARFVSGVLYAMPMVGTHPDNAEDFSFGLGLGARIPVDQLYFDIEGNSSNQLKDRRVDESAVDLRYRAAVGFRVTPWLGVFAGGGVRHQFHAKEGGEHRLRGFWNVGVDVF